MKKKFSHMISCFLKLCGRERHTGEYIKKIYPRADREAMCVQIWKKRLVCMGVLLVFVMFSAGYVFLSQPEKSGLSGDRFITREEEDGTIELTVIGTTAKSSWKKKISLPVKQRQFSEKEKQELMEQTEQYITKMLPGENESLQMVCTPLRLVNTVPDTGITLSWTVDDTYLKESGEIKRGTVPAEGVWTDLMVAAAWKNWKHTFYFRVYLYAKQLSEEETVKQNVRDTIKKEIKKQAAKEVIELPNRIGDTVLHYETDEEKKDFSVLYISLLALFLVPMLWFRKQKKELESREIQLFLDHPALVNRVMLLLGAGLTVRRVIERLADEYEQSRKKGGEIHYVYEEICVMAQEIRDGVSESRAVERFGRRCGLLPYLRFASVITQNLKKGAEGILDILERESMDALEKRKARVLQLGEMAGTKLLFPMIIMLGIVMGILMVPAFMTM